MIKGSLRYIFSNLGPVDLRSGLLPHIRQTDQNWRWWVAPAGAPTTVDWCWLAVAAIGLACLAALLVTFFMIP
jgi:hypothetical protein